MDSNMKAIMEEEDKYNGNHNINDDDLGDGIRRVSR